MQAYPHPATDADNFGVGGEGHAPGSDPTVHTFTVFLDYREYPWRLVGDYALQECRELGFVAERRLSGRIRDQRVQRKEVGLERAEVAKAVRCTPQKIGHLETATVPPKVKDLEEVLLPMYKVPKDRWPYYLQAARDARKKGWWESHTEALPNWFSLYIGLEQGASEFYSWDPQLVHGLLQTRDYMTAVVRGVSTELADTEVERIVDVRLARQSILDSDQPPRLWMVISEAALRSNIGGPRTMRAQLMRILDMAERPRIIVQVLPQDVGAHPGLRGPVIIMGFPTEGDTGVVYIEYRTGALYLEDVSEVKDHQISFEHLRSLTLSPAASRKRIAAIAEELT